MTRGGRGERVEREEEVMRGGAEGRGRGDEGGVGVMREGEGDEERGRVMRRGGG